MARPDGAFLTVALPLGTDGKSPALSLVLRFPGAQAGKKLWVHPIDGGSSDGQEGPRAVDIGADASAAVTFQPPARPGLYRLTLRLDGVETVLRLRVIRSEDQTDPRLPAEFVVGGAALPTTK